jgi:hypothetical protein
MIMVEGPTVIVKSKKAINGVSYNLFLTKHNYPDGKYHEKKE